MDIDPGQIQDTRLPGRHDQIIYAGWGLFIHILGAYRKHEIL